MVISHLIALSKSETIYLLGVKDVLIATVKNVSFR
jgi:hypothetical protein